MTHLDGSFQLLRTSIFSSANGGEHVSVPAWGQGLAREQCQGTVTFSYSFLLFFVTASLLYDSHIIQFTHFKYIT